MQRPFASKNPRQTGGRHIRPAAGFCFSALMLGCTPYGSELADTLASPEDGDDPASEGAVEAVYGPIADDDREQPVETHAEDPRCFADAHLERAWEIADPTAEPETGMMGVQRNGKFLALPLQKTKFDTVVVGTVSETEVVQVFANPFDTPIEAVYVFPLHERAAVDDYHLTIGERTIRGQMKTREDARETYEQAKQDGRAAGLLEQERPNVFTQSIANIPPGAVIEVSIHVVAPLEQDHGRYSLVLPTVVGPRFIPSASQVPDASRITPPMMPEGYTACADLEVTVALESGLRPRGLRSQYHDVDIRREGDVAFVELDRKAGPVLANRDFVLSWDLGGQQPQAAIVAQPSSVTAGGGHFTLTVQPPRLVPDEQATPRELVFVLDTSGSMSGLPLDTSKQLMRHALADMRPDDMFNVLRFDDSTSGLSSTLLPATKGNIEKGIAYIDALEGAGGTNMLAGIDAALDFPREPGRMRMVLFLTDGYIGNEAEIFAILERDIADARLFSLGVGSSVNRYLLDGMARVGRGAVTYAGNEQSMESVVETFYERIETPVLTDIEIDWQGAKVAEVLPGRIPDLFAGQPLTVFGRYEGQPSGEIIVRGKANGKLVELPVAFEMAKADDVAGVSSIWARNKVDELLGYPLLTTPFEVDGSTEKAVVELALQYRIMTNYTSFVAVDERRIVEPNGEIRTVVQPLPIPMGSIYKGFGTGENYAVGGLGMTGTIGSGGSGYGRGSGGGFGGRGVRVPSVRNAQPTVTGSLDKDVIRRIVRAHINEIRSCYNTSLTHDPTLSGKVTIDMTIGADGKVSASAVGSNTTGDEPLAQCIAKVVKRWTFPKPAGGGTVKVTYPFVLSPG
jgi:Ca-activated chloride channel family protein